jgi:hypothetical protein
MPTPHHGLRLLALAALPVSLKASIFYTSAEATASGTTPLDFAPVQFAIETGTYEPGTYGAGFSGNFFSITAVNLGATKPGLVSNGSGQIISLSQDSSDFAVRLGAGVNIDSSASWTSGLSFLSKPGYPGTFNAGDRGYVGLRLGNLSVLGWNYGWADISHNVGGSITLHSFAMETTVDAPILAGAGVTAVPEPAETAFAAAVAAGSVAAFRARRRMQSRRAAGR